MTSSEGYTKFLVFFSLVSEWTCLIAALSKLRAPVHEEKGYLLHPADDVTLSCSRVWICNDSPPFCLAQGPPLTWPSTSLNFYCTVVLCIVLDICTISGKFFKERGSCITLEWVDISQLMFSVLAHDAHRNTSPTLASTCTTQSY